MIVPDIAIKHKWLELTVRQRHAAKRLGYTRASWNAAQWQPAPGTRGESQAAVPSGLRQDQDIINETEIGAASSPSEQQGNDTKEEQPQLASSAAHATSA